MLVSIEELEKHENELREERFDKLIKKLISASRDYLNYQDIIRLYIYNEVKYECMYIAEEGEISWDDSVEDFVDEWTEDITDKILKLINQDYNNYKNWFDAVDTMINGIKERWELFKLFDPFMGLESISLIDFIGPFVKSYSSIISSEIKALIHSKLLEKNSQEIKKVNIYK
ncbi:MAG: hypothetical protein PHU69_11200 [Fermentimonas sp.]|nr:hypothetical protein [Fermentimonas sp.]